MDRRLIGIGIICILLTVVATLAFGNRDDSRRTAIEPIDLGSPVADGGDGKEPRRKGKSDRREDRPARHDPSASEAGARTVDHEPEPAGATRDDGQAGGAGTGPIGVEDGRTDDDGEARRDDDEGTDEGGGGSSEDDEEDDATDDETDDDTETDDDEDDDDGDEEDGD